MKLNKSDLDNFENSLKVYKNHQEMISNRIHEVLTLLCKCLGTELDWWDYYNGDNGGRHNDGGSLAENYGEYISLYIITKDHSPIVYDNTELLSSFEKRYLTMENQDIIDMVNKEVQAELQAQQEKLKQELAEKEAKKQKKAEVLAKLSPEDRKILGK